MFLRKLKKAEAKGNEGAAERLKANKPRYSLDHIVKERSVFQRLLGLLVTAFTDASRVRVGQ